MLGLILRLYISRYVQTEVYFLLRNLIYIDIALLGKTRIKIAQKRKGVKLKLKNVLPIAEDHDEDGGGQVVAKGPDHHQHLAGDVVCFPLKR